MDVTNGVVDEAGLPGHPADIDVHVVTKDLGEGGADRFGCCRLHGVARYTAKES